MRPGEPRGGRCQRPRRLTTQHNTTQLNTTQHNTTQHLRKPTQTLAASATVRYLLLLWLSKKASAMSEVFDGRASLDALRMLNGSMCIHAEEAARRAPWRTLPASAPSHNSTQLNSTQYNTTQLNTTQQLRKAHADAGSFCHGTLPFTAVVVEKSFGDV